MNDQQEYIESYFEKQLTEDERNQFEERCIHDESFAREVAFYITTREGIRQKLLQEKKQQWAGDEGNIKSGSTPSNVVTLRKWLPYMVAASLIIAVAVYFVNRTERSKDLANQYIQTHFIELSQTMDASKDSLQQGISAYNDKDYGKALEIFQNIYEAHPDNMKAKKNIGLVYLMTKDYDKALQQFDQLASKKGLYRNPGTFLKALTLLERNNQGDKEQAKQLLEQVVNEKAEGNREAEEWLKKW